MAPLRRVLVLAMATVLPGGGTRRAAAQGAEGIPGGLHSENLFGEPLAKCDRTAYFLANPDQRDRRYPTTGYYRNNECTASAADAGAHFVTTFGANPGVATWLDGIAARQSTGFDPQPDAEEAEGSPHIAGGDAAKAETAGHDSASPAGEAVGEPMTPAETSGASS